MLIAGTEYDADHWAMEIAVAGCNFRCKGCHNKEAWDFNAGSPIRYSKIREQGRSGLVKKFHIIGGEPLHQNNQDLIALLHFLTFHFPEKPIMLFTGHEIDEIPHGVLRYCAYVKTGQYDERKQNYDAGMGYTLASTNQLLWVSASGRASHYSASGTASYFINTTNGRRYKWWDGAGDTSEVTPKVVHHGRASRLLRKATEALRLACNRLASLNSKHRNKAGQVSV